LTIISQKTGENMKNKSILFNVILIFFSILFSFFCIFAQTPRPVIPHETSAPKKKETNTDSVAEKRFKEISQEIIEDEIKSFRPKVPRLLRFLKNQNHDRRLLAVEFLGKSRDLGVIDILILTMKSDSISQVRSEAVAAVGMIAEYHNYKAVIPILINTLDDSSVGVKLSAAMTLFKLGEKNAEIPILENIFCRNYAIFSQPEAVWTKTEIYRPDLSIQEQLEFAQEAKNGWPIAALELLTKIGTVRVKTFFTQCLQSPDPQIRKQAQSALTKLD
jgi:HEAT repeat protein